MLTKEISIKYGMNVPNPNVKFEMKKLEIIQTVTIEEGDDVEEVRKKVISELKKEVIESIK